jgi:hypothetical protein
MSDKEKGSDWMQKLWRPAMGWMYMLICLLDMAVFPVCWSLLQAFMHMPITQWNPLTLQGAGLFHIAMGAVLGIAAFGRTQEKLAGTAANPTATSQTAGGFGSGQQGGFGGPSNGGFGNTSSSGASAFGQSSSGGFGSPSGFNSPNTTGSGFGGSPSTAFNSAPSWGSTPTGVTTTASGKKVVPDFDQPVL